jgi:hypothetical protein
MDTTRASDTERERTAEQLRLAVGDGRLTLTDFDERLGAAYASVTRSELAQVTADLPSAPRPVAAAPAPSATRGWAEAWRGWLGGALIMVGIWAGTSLARGEFNGFWPAIPLGIWAAVLIASLVGGKKAPRACCTSGR